MQKSLWWVVVGGWSRPILVLSLSLKLNHLNLARPGSMDPHALVEVVPHGTSARVNPAEEPPESQAGPELPLVCGKEYRRLVISFMKGIRYPADADQILFRGNNLPLTKNASSLKDINLDTNIPLTGSEGSRMAPCSQRLMDLQPD